MYCNCGTIPVTARQCGARETRARTYTSSRAPTAATTKEGQAEPSLLEVALAARGHRIKVHPFSLLQFLLFFLLLRLSQDRREPFFLLRRLPLGLANVHIPAVRNAIAISRPSASSWGGTQDAMARSSSGSELHAVHHQREFLGRSPAPAWKRGHWKEAGALQ